MEKQPKNRIIPPGNTPSHEGSRESLRIPEKASVGPSNNPKTASIGLSKPKNTRSKNNKTQGAAGSDSNKSSGTGDSATQYLREMGRAALLTKEEEVVLAKQIENRQEVIKEAILEIPFVINEIKKLCNKAFEKTLSKISNTDTSEITPLPIQKSKRLSLLERVIDFLEVDENEMRNYQRKLRQDLPLLQKTALMDNKD